MDSWLTPTSLPPLEPDEIHIWRATDADVAAGCQSMLGVLSADEQARAARYKLDGDRTRFSFCRGALRTLLGRYTGRPADEIAFTYGPFGKPYLASNIGASGTSGGESLPVHFNISHTKGMALFAFSPSFSVGIDVEAMDPAQDWDSTARHFFHPDERAATAGLSSGQRASAGYALWTCKEACLKAVGEGIGGGLERFCVSPPSPGGDVRVDLPGGFAIDHVWLHRLDVGTGFAAALASIGRASSVRLWNWASFKPE
jgi:4'-phosphopantetheinyl transferase